MNDREKEKFNRESPPSGPSPRGKFTRNLFLLFIIFIVVISILNFVRINPSGQEQQVTYTQFLKMVEDGRISKVIIKGQSIKGKINERTYVAAYSPPDPELISILRNKNVEIEAVPETSSWWMSFLGGILPIIIFVGIWFWIFRQMRITGNKALSFGKSRAKLASKEKIGFRLSLMPFLAVILRLLLSTQKPSCGICSGQVATRR